ncbi:MAG: DUF1640 domain-containing protein [Pseudomonadota bacterium]
MNTLALDTHKTIRKLQSRGFSEEQAEGIIETLTESQLVTKSDLATEISGLEMRLYRAMLIQTGATAALVIGIVQFAL